MKKFRERLTYANVMATLAVFMVIGGGAYAAGLAKNSVGSKQIRDDSVRGIDVKADSLKGADIDESKLTLPEGPRGPQGLQGPEGPAGDFDAVDGQQIIDKITNGFDGSGSFLNADAVDGIDSIDLGPTFSNILYLDGDPASSEELFTLFLSNDGQGRRLRFHASCSGEGPLAGSEITFDNEWLHQPILVWANGNGPVEVPADGGQLSTDTLADPKHVDWLISTQAGTNWTVTTGQGAIDSDEGDCVFVAQATTNDPFHP